MVVRLRAFHGPIRWLAAALPLALAVGLLSSASTKYAVALAAGVAGLVILAVRQEFILPVLVASVFVEILSVGGVPISRLIAPLALLVILGTVSGERVRLVERRPLPWITCYCLWAFASTFWTVDSGGTAYQLSSLAVALIYMTSFAILLRERRDVVRILTAVSIAAFVIGIIAMAGFFLGIASELKQGRASGGTGDPNYFATYQVVALPLVLVLTTMVKSGARRIALYVVMLVIVASVLTSLSRGGVLTLVAVLLMVAAIPARRLYGSPGQKLVFLVVILAAGGFALATTAKDLVPRIETVLVNKQETTSTGRGSGRLDLWLAARSAFLSHPYTGIGYGAFPSQSNQLLLQTPGVNLEVNAIGNIGHEAHNAYLGSAAELGIPGAAFFVGILVSLFATLLRTQRTARRAGDEMVGRLAAALLVSLVAFAISSIFLSTETSRVLWIMLGMSLALPRLLTRPAPA
jgi:O-antigen ligase